MEPGLSQETWKGNRTIEHLEEQAGQEANSHKFGLYK